LRTSSSPARKRQYKEWSGGNPSAAAHQTPMGWMNKESRNAGIFITGRKAPGDCPEFTVHRALQKKQPELQTIIPHQDMYPCFRKFFLLSCLPHFKIFPMTARIRILIPVLTGLLVSACQTANHPRLSPFKSDGCSCFPDGTLKQPDLWKRHCIEHDYAYWKGGTREERKAADMKLRDGIRAEGKPLVAEIAYAGVRIGGTPWLPTQWRWGFGWSGFPRGYREVERRTPPAGQAPIHSPNPTGNSDPDHRPVVQ
jgi:hypothetical protein